MNKENNRGAAGLRRSAIAERIRLREEWSALKEIDSQPTRTNINVLKKKQMNVKTTSKKLSPVKDVMRARVNVPAGRLNRQSNTRSPADALRGVVALVEVGTESRALPLRAALTALGASVMPAWSPLITHLIWAEGGCRSTRARARALASALVSPLWVEACAAASVRLPERAFPAAARASDLPSPCTLRQMLKKAEAENMLLVSGLTDSSDKEKLPRLRISSDAEDTSADTSIDTSHDTSHDTSKDTTHDTSDTSRDTTADREARVNTAPRRALPRSSGSTSPQPPRARGPGSPQPAKSKGPTSSRLSAKSRRKLFTHKEAELAGSSDDEEEHTRPLIPRPSTATQVRAKPALVTHAGRKELARAERMARKFLEACSRNKTKPPSTQKTPRIVMTGMCRTERREVRAAILSLNGRTQKRVNKWTTHVILGSIQRSQDRDHAGITGITNLTAAELSRVVHRSELKEVRTLAALCGAARGCRVLSKQWILDCAANKSWLHHAGYEVPHLKKISQKARVERSAFSKLRSEYAYDVFYGMRVFVTSSAEQRDAAIQLLELCGAVVQNGETQHGGTQHDATRRILHGQGLTQLDRLLGNASQKRTQALSRRTQLATVTQNGEIRYDVVVNSSNDFDIKIGVANGEVSSKWVFDSVAAARMRTTRRYVISELSNSQANEMTEEMANFCIDDC